jgi:hypothetical protein
MYIQPKPKKSYFLKGFILFEITAFIGSYLVWKKLNNSQNFRYLMSKKAPFILEGYYQIGEKAGNLKTREYDLSCWQSTTTIKND